MGTSPGTPARHGGGLLGPVLLMIVGIMFLVDHLDPAWGIRKTWPILLIVIGVFKLLEVGRLPRGPEGPRV